eukprot:180525-Amphidinium_carterae.1
MPTCSHAREMVLFPSYARGQILREFVGTADVFVGCSEGMLAITSRVQSSPLEVKAEDAKCKTCSGSGYVVEVWAEPAFEYPHRQNNDR